jgi:hypothetical protein
MNLKKTIETFFEETWEGGFQYKTKSSYDYNHTIDERGAILEIIIKIKLIDNEQYNCSLSVYFCEDGDDDSSSFFTEIDGIHIIDTVEEFFYFVQTINRLSNSENEDFFKTVCREGKLKEEILLRLA